MTLLTILLFPLALASHGMDCPDDHGSYTGFKQQRYIALPRDPDMRLNVLSQTDLKNIHEVQKRDHTYHRERRVFELSIETYSLYLQHLFDLMLRGYKIDPNVDQPNWIIWTHPQIVSTGREVRLCLLRRDLSHGSLIGAIPTGGNATIEHTAIEICKRFIKQTTSAEEPFLTFGDESTPDEQPNRPYWTAIDALLLKMAIEIPKSVSPDEKVLNFINWHKLILGFLEVVQGIPEADGPSVQDMFQSYLLDRLVISTEKAHFFAHFMDERHYNIIKVMSAFDPHNDDHVDTIYDKFLEAGIFPSQFERDLSRVTNFRREADTEIWGPVPVVKSTPIKFPVAGGCREAARDGY